MIYKTPLTANRRSFIKTLAAAGFGAALGNLSATAQQPPVPMSRRRPYSLRSEVPITYIRDYSSGHLNNDDFIQSIADNTPELLILGKDAPIHHNWGPVEGAGGENQAFGSRG